MFNKSLKYGTGGDNLTMTEAEMRRHRCCFTGHRPEKLGAPAGLVRRQLAVQIQRAVDDGYTTFISGVSRGVDLWAAQIVLQLRQTDPTLRLICAIPFPGFEAGWSDDWRVQYAQVLQAADLCRYISERFSRQAYQVRNRWMVRHSALLIAAYTGAAGGTRSTIAFAQGTPGCEIRYLDLGTPDGPAG